jgi:hypothetical protein
MSDLDVKEDFTRHGIRRLQTRRDGVGVCASEFNMDWLPEFRRTWAVLASTPAGRIFHFDRDLTTPFAEIVEEAMRRAPLVDASARRPISERQPEHIVCDRVGRRDVWRAFSAEAEGMAYTRDAAVRKWRSAMRRCVRRKIEQLRELPATDGIRREIGDLRARLG